MRFASELTPVALGGALGACSRFILTRMTVLLPLELTLGTLLANSLGSFCAGILLGFMMLGSGPSPGLKLFFMTGFLGAFTTFSAFSYETMELYLGEQYRMALVNILVNVSGALVSVVVGYWLVQRISA